MSAPLPPSQPLPATPPLDDLLADQLRRWRRGDPVPVEAYLEQYPALRDNTAALLDLIGNERRLRAEAGEAPALPEYLQRFPRLADGLRLGFDPGRAPDGQGGLPPTAGEPGGTLPDVASPPADAPAPEGYRILGELGRGGMGVAYKAWQVRLKRVVALKVIRAAATDTAAALSRFRLEAEAAARLQHPNIVQIHEVGEAGGRPYLALEYIDGGTLAARFKGTPQPARPTAALVETLARAMHYAHQNGVVHRDLKPGNVLLTRDGTPKITDFGLAKLVEVAGGAGPAAGAVTLPPADALTPSWAILGTPEYMAPEQAAGKARLVGPPADVYALGAVLYDALTGRPPFKGETPTDTLLQVLADDPVPPRRLQPRVPADLETICLKCLHKDPHRRYATAEELAEDLRRFQAGEPIRARPVGRAELLVRWCRRNPAVAGLLAALAAVLAGGIVTVVCLWVRAERMRERADANYREAQANFQLALDAVDQYCTRVGEDKRLQEKDLRPLRQQLLQTAVDFQQKFVEQRGDEAGLRAELGRAYLRLGQLTAEIDAKPRAIHFYERGAAAFEELSRGDPGSPGYRRSLATARRCLGSLYDETGRPADAEAALLDAVRLGERLGAEDPDGAVDQAALADTLARLSFFYQRNGRAKEAEEPALRSIGLSEGLVRRFPEVAAYRVDLVRSRAALGDLYRLHSGLRRWRDAEKEYLACLELQRDLVAREPRNPEHQNSLANLHRVLGIVYRVSRRPREAEQSFKEGIKIMEELVRRHGSVASYRMALAELDDSLGAVYNLNNRLAEAEGPWQEALRLRRQLADEDPTDADYLCALGVSQFHVGLVHKAGRRHAEAVDHFSRAIGTLEDVRGRNPQLSRATRNLASALEERARSLAPLGGHAEALRDWDRVLELTGASALRPMYRMERTLALARTGDHARATAEAEQLLREFAADSHFAGAAYNTAAAVHAVAARAARGDAGLPEAERGARSERYAARAVALLREAARAGCDLGAVKGDTDFDFLRPREDFKELLAELSKRDGIGKD